GPRALHLRPCSGPLDEYPARPALPQRHRPGARQGVSLRWNRQWSGSHRGGVTPMSVPFRILLLALLGASAIFADAGVLIPGDREQPDPAIFSLNEMAVEVRIDNGIARVQIRQIFANHDAKIQEGVYHFALPAKASISDFAVWD